MYKDGCVIRCTVAILTLNSGATLERCLESVKQCAEILILDGNSTDNTLDIAKKFSARVERQYDTDEKNVLVKDFSALRIKSYSLARHNWVFYVDSDEWVSAELFEQIKEAVEENNPQKAFAFSRIAVIDNIVRHYAFFYPDWCVRLWNKNSGVRFKENKIVHEQIFVPSGVEVVRLNGALYASWPDITSFRRKNDFYLELVAKKTRTKILSLYDRFHQLRAAAGNFTKSFGIFFKIIFTTLRGARQDTVPFSYSFCFVMYHLRIAWIRLLAALRHWAH